MEPTTELTLSVLVTREEYCEAAAEHRRAVSRGQGNALLAAGAVLTALRNCRRFLWRADIPFLFSGVQPDCAGNFSGLLQRRFCTDVQPGGRRPGI